MNVAARAYRRQHGLYRNKECPSSKPKWLKILAQRYLLVSEICTMMGSHFPRRLGSKWSGQNPTSPTACYGRDYSNFTTDIGCLYSHSFVPTFSPHGYETSLYHNMHGRQCVHTIFCIQCFDGINIGCLLKVDTREGCPHNPIQ